jgi:hypothetical protein
MIFYDHKSSIIRSVASIIDHMQLQSVMLSKNHVSHMAIVQKKCCKREEKV